MTNSYDTNKTGQKTSGRMTLKQYNMNKGGSKNTAIMHVAALAVQQLT